MTAPVVFLMLCLPLVSGSSVREKLQTRVADNNSGLKSPHMETPFTIDEAIRKTSGGSTEKSYKRTTRGQEEITDGLDMVITPRQYARLYLGIRSRSDDSHMIATPWTNGVIPYVVENNDFSQVQRDRISGAMKNWQNLTCIHFRPATSQDDNQINIHYGRGCWAHLGMKGGVQTVNLDTNGCFWKGTVEHELGHAIGLIHEHQRPQRDGYMRVNYYAVGRTSVAQLTKYARGSDDKMGLAYDYDSVMHYGKTAFARVYGTQTIYTRDPDKEDVIGMTLYPSFLDAKLVNMMYKCNAHCQSPPTCHGDCFVDKHCRCFCPSDMPIERCIDQHRNCSEWAQRAECDRNPGYMHDKCRKSCNICNDNGAVPKLPCVNGHPNCEEWAKQGECEANPSYMKSGCKPACGLCTPGGGPDTGPCRDKDAATCQARKEKGDCIRKAPEMLKDCKQTCDFCPGSHNDPTNRPGACEDPDQVCTYYSDNGLCYKFYTTMSLKCRKACGTCNKTITIPDGCEDTNPSCSAWALSGECDANPGYMLKACMISCNKCPGIEVPDVCVDYDMDCPSWADRGECFNNPLWMPKNCKKSCGICGNITVTPGPCVDENPQCPQWKDMGECDRNPGWMRRHCQKSCGTCPGQWTTPPPGDGDCVDDNADCPYWAMYGECKLNPGYMLIRCKRSCGVCGGVTGTQEPVTSPGDCVDENTNCPAWADSGECNKNPGYMLIHCKKSCGVCDGGTGTQGPVTTPGDCVDENTNCPVWADYGECNNNPGYMLIRCKKSCNVCGGGTGTTPGNCVDKNTNCPGWADYGECNNNPGYMLHFCKKSCGVCDGGTGTQGPVTTPGGGCIDGNRYCPDWAAHGECDNNPGYMHLHCKKSCHICR